jgi:hypothetical protein
MENWLEMDSIKPTTTNAENAKTKPQGKHERHFWKPPFPRVVSSLHKEPPERRRTISVSAEDGEKEETIDNTPSRNIYDTFGFKLLKLIFGLFFFLVVLVGSWVNKETFVFFAHRDLKDENVFSYLLMMGIAPLIPVLFMDLVLRWVREKERSWKKNQKVEKIVVRPIAVYMVVRISGIRFFFSIST